jgi:signal transduction histidine kinase/ligand-binding sensor domain-containing protein
MSGLIAQPRHLQFLHLTQDDGLSSSIITSIIQDHKGLMWFGTPDGLNRYDGINYLVYRNNPADSTSLIDNVVQTLFEDHNDNLFIGTENGLCLYDRAKDSFLNYFSDSKSPMKGLGCTVSRIVEDTLGNLWLATNAGLIYYNRHKNNIIRFTHDASDPESLCSDNVVDVKIDNQNNLWVTTRKGLNLFLWQSKTFRHISRADGEKEDLTNTIFNYMIEDKQGDLWIGSTEGVYCLANNRDNKTFKLIHYKNDISDNSSISSNQVTSLFVDNTGNLWIGTENGGINLFDREHKNFWHYKKDDFDAQSLSNESVEAIYQDITGNLWFGTFTGGLNVATKNRDAIVHYQNLPGVMFSLSHNTVSALLEDHQGQIWVGTDGGGLNLFNSQINRFLRFNMQNSNLTSNSILCMAQTYNDQVWLGTWGGGLVKFNDKSGAFTSFTTKNSKITDNSIFAILVGEDNDLWLGSFEHGLIHYQINKNKFTEYTPQNSGLANEMVIKIVKLTEGRLLIGTATSFQIFSTVDNKFVTYGAVANDLNSLSYNRVTDILVENDTCVWIGTPDGLNRFNPRSGSFKRFYEKDGLPNSFIKALSLDNTGILWITTNKGVSRFDYKGNRFKNFTKADGLQGNEFSERSILRTNSGAVYVGGIKGFNIIYPEKIIENTHIPDVLITDLKIFNKSVKPGVKNSPLTQNITETKTLILSYSKSVLSFNFAVMDFTAPEKNQFAYKMSDFDKDWIYSGNKSEATYTNLSPGEYVFHVKGSNNDGVWNESGTSLRIIILPPWWKTLWFRLIILLTIILMFLTILYLRVRQLKNQKTVLERSVAMKTRELTGMNLELNELNASKDKFFSIIAHDLKTPFNTIIGFSNILKEEIGSGEIRKLEESAEIINTSAVQTLRLLENLLEWANSQRGKINFNPLSFNLSQLIQEEFLMINDMASGKNIELRSLIPDSLTVLADKNMIRTVLRNLITNALKFTHKNGLVEVSSITSLKHLEIAVSDNGIGISQESIAKLFRIDSNLSTRGTENEKGTGLGLILCKEFVEKHGGTIWVESNEGEGSTFKFTLPINTLPEYNP